MKTKKVTRYYAECGRGFWNKRACVNHEGNCHCWTNPKNKACLTCKYSNVYSESDEGEGRSNSYKVRECLHPSFNEESMKPIAIGAKYVYDNCELWKLKNKK